MTSLYIHNLQPSRHIIDMFNAGFAARANLTYKHALRTVCTGDFDSDDTARQWKNAEMTVRFVNLSTKCEVVSALKCDAEEFMCLMDPSFTIGKHEFAVSRMYAVVLIMQCDSRFALAQHVLVTDNENDMALATAASVSAINDNAVAEPQTPLQNASTPLDSTAGSAVPEPSQEPPLSHTSEEQPVQVQSTMTTATSSPTSSTVCAKPPPAVSVSPAASLRTDPDLRRRRKKTPNVNDPAEGKLLC
jgi:hypothetical protein